MPLSKNNVLYYTEEQKALADQNSNALEYALSHGYNLVKEGSYYKMREHDSMVFKPDGYWFWNSRRVCGRAPEFIVQYEGLTYVEAILKLAGESEIAPVRQIPKDQPSSIPADKPEFKLPTKAETEKQLFAYLCKTRKLSENVVREMLDQGILYQSAHVMMSGKTIYNACFVSHDENGEPCSAFNRGLASEGKPFKGEIPGGDKSHGWIFRGENPQKLYVFEACIDAASYVTLGERVHADPLKSADYMALGGLSFEPIMTYLTNHPEVKSVHLMLDGDEPGQEAAQSFQKRLSEMGYEVRNHLPPRKKDWNEYMQSIPIQERERSPPPLTTEQRMAEAIAAAASQQNKPRGHSKALER